MLRYNPGQTDTDCELTYSDSFHKHNNIAGTAPPPHSEYTHCAYMRHRKNGIPIVSMPV